MSSRKYIVLDSWAYVKDDASPENIEATKQQFRDTWSPLYSKLEIRTFQRNVKAGGACFGVTVIVVRVKMAKDGGL